MLYIIINYNICAEKLVKFIYILNLINVILSSLYNLYKKIKL
jgi:hypothetical protein